MVHRVGALELVTNVEPAAWIVKQLHPFTQDVGSVIPEGYEAYARVFHPAYRNERDGNSVPVRWWEIASANGRIVHPEMQFPGITGSPGPNYDPQPGVWDEEPELGSMPKEVAIRLAAILTAYTGTPTSCWFAVWNGFGNLNLPQDAPKFSIPYRDLFLLRGPLEAVAESPYVGQSADASTLICWPDDASVEAVTEAPDLGEWCYQSPNLWWPEDRAWCVATEIDFSWTYVGGSAACVRAILADPALEALPARIEDGITWDSDRRNPCPPGSNDGSVRIPCPS